MYVQMERIRAIKKGCISFQVCVDKGSTFV